MSDIIIAGAVPQELKTLSDELQASQTSDCDNTACVSGFLSGTPVRLLATGPGVLNTVHTLTIAVMQKRPRLIIQTGCGGLFKGTGGTVGDIAIASCDIDLQTGIESVETQAWQPPETLPFTIAENKGRTVTNQYPADRHLAEKCIDILQRPGKMSTGPQIYYGPFVTVSTITASDKRAAAIEALYSPCIESMEGSAAAYVAFIYGLPFVEIRAASNMTGKRNRDRWDINLACERCGDAVRHLIGEKCFSD